MNKGSKGYTLVELMIAVTLGLILTAGVITVFVNTKQGFRLQESAGRMQENMRTSIEVLARTIRQADFWSGVKTNVITGTPAVNAYSIGSTCTASWITTVSSSNVSQGLVGYAGAGSTPIDCIASGDYVASSDMLAVRYADPNTFRTTGFASAPASTQVFLRTFLGVPTGGMKGYLFLGSDVSSADTRIPGSSSVFNYQYRASLIFLRPCSVKAGAACAATDDSGHPIPTLATLDLQGSSLVQSPLVEGVEMVRYLYGIDTDGDLVVDLYCTASQIINASGSCTSGWGSVLSVRAGLVVRGDLVDNFTDRTTYTLPGGFTYGPSSCGGCSATYSGTVARNQRRLITKDIQLRNRTRV